jgi:hypothetical protein
MSGSGKPCPLVLIEWEDSAQPTCAWEHLADWRVGGVVRIASVGWLIKDGKRIKALAPNMGGIDGRASVQVSGVIRIPTRCVVSIVKLKEGPQ